ncbi:unnamed protein product, partial [Ectocarpus sp. 12 AP-2014]
RWATLLPPESCNLCNKTIVVVSGTLFAVFGTSLCEDRALRGLLKIFPLLADSDPRSCVVPDEIRSLILVYSSSNNVCMFDALCRNTVSGQRCTWHMMGRDFPLARDRKHKLIHILWARGKGKYLDHVSFGQDAQ